jgi:hypothetical protein
LRKIAEGEFGNLGDTSTLADPTVVDDLVNNRQNRKDAQGSAGQEPAQATRMPPPQPQPAVKAKPGNFFNKLFGG